MLHSTPRFCTPIPYVTSRLSTLAFTVTPTAMLSRLSLHDALPIFLEPDVVDVRSHEIADPKWDTHAVHRVRIPLRISDFEIGRAHVRTPVTWPSRTPSSA